jgi:hypothetical protein
MAYLGNAPTSVPLSSADILDSAITSAKIADGTIVNADINASSAIAISKISATGTANQVLRMNSGATALEFATIASTSNVKAWINFDGTGTPSIRASLNVSSITDNNTGDYTVNFTSALTDANYAVAGDGAVSGTVLSDGTYNRGPTLVSQALSSSSFRMKTSQLWTTGIEDLALITYIVTR